MRITQLLRAALGARRPVRVGTSSRTGLTVVWLHQVVTSEDVRTLDDA